VAVEQALDRARADVADGARGLDRHRPHARAQIRRDSRRGRLLEHLLVAALERAVALPQVDRRAVAVGQDLISTLARILDVLLDVDGGVGEVRLALAPRGLERAPASAAEATTSSPRPPPPAEALIAIGQP